MRRRETRRALDALSVTREVQETVDLVRCCAVLPAVTGRGSGRSSSVWVPRVVCARLQLRGGWVATWFTVRGVGRTAHAQKEKRYARAQAKDGRKDKTRGSWR